MSVTSALVSFAVVAALLTIVPGLDTAYVLRTAIVGGRRPAFAAAAGIGTGSLAWGAAAAVGVSALLTASTLAYTALRITGAAYLVWLGVQLIRETLGRRGATAAAPEPTDSDGAWRAWRRGVLTNLLNPKVGAFYLAVIPQFLPEHAPHLLMGLALALVHNAEGMLWFTALILGAHAVRGWLRRPVVHRAIDRVTGTALIGFGLKLAAAPR
ncbi:LysE family translocator [Cryptosporangium aurantiacum]|uniref:Threonine/homoserine/homoserine lactone efflux protein n=1 Tax=Cryptosporangium aurantiacum TaxID=134849 RepID=A0A1M7RJ04_9ACTN|nr:LysE family translocator [Cryptosporangium aurantiacum]SHN46254.1 Threonine/homoserine/homoserine lactone efflux protein [Cryptosporangium aurantiacum]